MPLPTWLTSGRAKTTHAGWTGVHIGRDQILVACARQTPGGKPGIHKLQRFAGPDRIEALLDWQKTNAPKGNQTNLLLEPSDYQILQIDAPPVEPSELQDAVRWLLKDLIDFPPHDAALDCMTVPGEHTGNSPSRVLSVVTRKSVVGAWMLHWHKAKLALSSIDIAEMALRNIAVLASGEQAVAFLHVGWETTSLIIVWQQSLCTFRQLNIGGGQLLAMDDLERSTLFERFALEIQRTTDAFGRQFSAANLTIVWLSSVVDAPGVARDLSAQIDLRVQPFLLDDWLNLEDPPREEDVEQRLDYTLAIGAALRMETMP